MNIALRSTTSCCVVRLRRLRRRASRCYIGPATESGDGTYLADETFIDWLRLARMLRPLADDPRPGHDFMERRSHRSDERRDEGRRDLPLRVRIGGPRGSRPHRFRSRLVGVVPGDQTSRSEASCPPEDRGRHHSHIVRRLRAPAMGREYLSTMSRRPGQGVARHGRNISPYSAKIGYGSICLTSNPMATGFHGREQEEDS